jgi:hypothetical protein
MKQSVDNGSQSFDASANGSLTISNSDPANSGKTLLIREDASGAYPFLLGVTYAGLESASAVGSVTAPHQDSMVQCGTGNDPGVCDCTPDGCELSDYSEASWGITIPDVGDISTIAYSSFIHADLTGDPPSVPEPAFPWGLPLLLGTLAIPYLRMWKRLG